MMSLTELIVLTVKVSIMLTVLGFALNATLADATYLFRHPGKLLRAVLSMNVVMLAAAALLVTLFNLDPAVKVALIALAMSPVPPFLPAKAFKAGGRENYTIGLLTGAGVLSIVLIPLSLELLQRVYQVPLGMPSPTSVALVVLKTILAPLAVGILIHTLAPNVANKIARPITLVATVMLVAGTLPILIAATPSIWSLIGNGAIVAFLVFVAIGLISGHLLGGPDPDERMVLAFSTASRHPGVALAIAHANFPQQKLALAAVLLYVLISIVASIPYQKWFAKHQATRDTAHA